jgi:hypothetical protein
MKNLILALALLGCAGSDGAAGPPGEQGERGPMGTPGVMGAPGIAGPPGAPGAPGKDGASGSGVVIQKEILCQVTVGAVFFGAYIWLMSDGNEVGICTLSESLLNHDQTEPIIGTQCALSTVSAGAITIIDFSANPPVLSGGFVGTMGCL